MSVKETTLTNREHDREAHGLHDFSSGVANGECIQPESIEEQPTRKNGRKTSSHSNNGSKERLFHGVERSVLNVRKTFERCADRVDRE